jgi:hypothetical protein
MRCYAGLGAVGAEAAIPFPCGDGLAVHHMTPSVAFGAQNRTLGPYFGGLTGDPCSADGVPVGSYVEVTCLWKIPVVDAEDQDAALAEAPRQQRPPRLVPNRPCAACYTDCNARITCCKT